MALLEVQEVAIRFGGVTALDDLSFTVDAGQICALIGPNGAGKTTFFNVLSRVYQPGSGTIRLDGQDLLRLAPHQIAAAGIARTFQNLALWPGLTVLENVLVGAHAGARRNVIAVALNLGRRRQERELRDTAFEVLDTLGLADIAHEPAEGLPFGTMKRIELARALVSNPRLLLLDEPANGLTHQEVDSLGTLIRSLRDRWDLTVLLVEHHMSMVMGISDRVVVLDYGQKLAEGAPAEIAQDPRVIEAYLGTPA